MLFKYLSARTTFLGVFMISLHLCCFYCALGRCLVRSNEILSAQYYFFYPALCMRLLRANYFLVRIVETNNFTTLVRAKYFLVRSDKVISAH